MTSSFFGEISREWKENWGYGHEPYDVLEKMINIDCYFIGSSVSWWASDHCTDEVQVDWGSWAWKCKGKKLIELDKKSSTFHVPEIQSLDPDKTYGVLFIEEY